MSHPSCGPRVWHEGAPLRSTRKHSQCWGRDGLHLQPLSSSWDNTFCSEGQETWLADPRPASGKKSAHAQRPGGQVYLSPEKLCEAGGKGREKACTAAPREAGGGEEDWDLPKRQKLPEQLGRGTGTTGEAIPLSLSQEASWSSHS